MLRAGRFDVDRLPRQMCELTIDNRGAHVPCDRDQLRHAGRSYARARTAGFRLWTSGFGHCPKDRYSRKNRFTLMMNARLRVAGKLRASVSRSSLKTTNSSLPDRYSHRRRTFAETLFVLELNWISALTNISGVIV